MGFIGEERKAHQESIMSKSEFRLDNGLSFLMIAVMAVFVVLANVDALRTDVPAVLEAAAGASAPAVQVADTAAAESAIPLPH
jgi:hypothetical protein